jgi:hypothetical protein
VYEGSGPDSTTTVELFPDGSFRHTIDITGMGVLVDREGRWEWDGRRIRTRAIRNSASAASLTTVPLTPMYSDEWMLADVRAAWDPAMPGAFVSRLVLIADWRGHPAYQHKDFDELPTIPWELLWKQVEPSVR